MDRCTAALVSGSPSELVEQVREFYAQSELPRHPKKSVAQAWEAEVQGAWVDGTQGVVFAETFQNCKIHQASFGVVRARKGFTT